MATTANLNLWSILSESKRIINAHSRHFLALSVFFLLPLSFSLIVSPTIIHLLTPSNSSTIHILLRLAHTQAQAQVQAQTTFLNSPFPFPLLLLSLFLLIFSLSALATITHSIFHGFFGRPVKLISAFTSLLSSFLPLLTTFILSHLILFSLSLPIPLFLLTPSFSFSSITLTLTAYALFLPLIFVLFYLRISWTLASVIAVVERTWGFQPLRRSAALMKGMKSVGVSCLLFFASLEGIMLWSGSLLAEVASSDRGSWRDWAFVVQIVLTSTVLTILMLYNVAANTVLYMYCKAVHGELASEIAEEFAWQYVSLPFDDSKVPHVVSVVHV
ncbi:uncharacterized protein [Cicer arietinum]|uniref:Uncharacterized protein LOC101497270 n=1 Tax=Cicer arietinum TaxID=3827 RepID=A0A3Q7WX00_CICAR|nr:uncharacterized protein LOC101497270 [Cicer arietinum]